MTPLEIDPGESLRVILSIPQDLGQLVTWTQPGSCYERLISCFAAKIFHDEFGKLLCAGVLRSKNGFVLFVVPVAIFFCEPGDFTI